MPAEEFAHWLAHPHVGTQSVMGAPTMASLSASPELQS
jgi:hypothetical protein